MVKRTLFKPIESHTAKIIVLCIILFMVLPMVNAWFDYNWDYRKAVTITENSGVEINNYTVKINVSYVSKMQSDYDDLRFIDDDDTSELNYWMEPGMNSSDTAIFWVKVDNITASSTKTIYMYYGHSTASSKSNISTTFLFGDDFDRANSATIGNGWGETDGSGAVTILNNQLRIQDGSPTGSVAERNFTINHNTKIGMLYRQVQKTAEVYWYFGGNSTNRHKLSFKVDGNPAFEYYNGTAGAYDANTQFYNLGAWTHQIYDIDNDNERFNWTINGTLVCPYCEHRDFNDKQISRFSLETANAGTLDSIYVDYFFVANYTSAEPTAAFGAEEFSYILENSQSYNTTTYETDRERFILNLTWNSTVYPTISANLIYNGTSYLGTQYGSSGEGKFTKILDVPLLVFGTQENRSFYWEVILSNQTGSLYENSSTYNQTVNSLIYTIHNSSYTSPIVVNYTIYNETSRASINATMDATFDYWIGGGTVYRTYSLDSGSCDKFNFTTNYNYNRTFHVNPVINLEKSGYVERTFYLYDEKYDNETITERKLFLIAEGTNVIIQVRDAGLSPAENYYIEIERYYPQTDEYEVVERLQTDIYGQAVARLVENTVKYRFTFKDSTGVVKKTTGDMTVACRTTICVLPFVIEDVTDDVEERFENLTDYDWSFRYDETNHQFIFTWNDISGVSATSRLLVTRYQINASTVVCNTTSGSASGTLTCNVGTQDASYQGQVFRYVSGSIERRIGFLSIQVSEAHETFGNEGLLWSFFLLMTLISIGYWKPVVGVVAYLFGIILLWIPGIIYLNPAILVAELAIGIAFIWAWRR